MRPGGVGLNVGMPASPNASSHAERHAAIRRALAELDTPADGWPAWVFDVPYDGGQYPGREDACPLPDGANCQRYAYAVLATQGLSVPPYFSSDLWDDPGMQHVTWADRRPLDLVLFSPSDDPCGAHMGVVLGDAVLHLCHEVGVPAVWTLDDFAARQRYAHLLGPVRVA